MANKDYNLPHQDLIALVPQNLRNPMVKSLVDNLFNRFLTQDEAVPMYGYVGRKPTSPDDRTPKVPQSSVERDVNALIPVLSFKVGAETYSFTAEDLIRKAEVLGISADQSSWLYSQGNNYAPPINYDKFTNFFNYYWVADALPSKPILSWNPSNAPEYYTIAAPKLTDADKLNVRVSTTGATVLTGTGFYPQTWTVEFTSATQFTVKANGALVGFGPGEDLQGPFTLPALAAVAAPGPYTTHSFPVQFIVQGKTLVSFNVVRDVLLDNGTGPYPYEGFVAGDKFTISAPFISSSYSVTFSGGPGPKGKIATVNALDTYQTIDGVVLKENDRVLVRHGAAADQGIYVVSAGAWARAADFTTGTAASGAKVFVTEGSQANTLFESFASGVGYGWNVSATNTISNTNDWQESNYWVKRDDLVAQGVDLSKVVQAIRPIIEFNSNLQLNTHVQNGVPSDTGTVYEQVKTEFNQAPLYDLYYYDGLHAQKVTPIFFYVEDPTANIDVALQRRAKHSTNSSADFLFHHGLLSADNSLLFYKDKAGELHTIWHPGYSTPTVVDQTYGGTGNGTLTVTIGSDPFSAQQIWTLTAITPTEFSIIGSKQKVLPDTIDTITVGTPYTNPLFNATIVAGSTAFAVGDTFKFRIGNLETTRYVYRDSDEALFDFYGGPAADANGVGAWQVPRMFFNNVAADNGGELPEGTLYSHFRGILANQLTESEVNKDDAFGGSIKLWSEQQNLLASLLMERDLTPVSIIDLAQRQYATAINEVADIYMTHITTYFSQVEVLSRPADVGELLDYILAIRAKDNDVKTVLYDSTSPLIGFPATLPMLGFSELVKPGIIFDSELGATLRQHHDGHLSPLFVQDQGFRDKIFSSKLTIERSDKNVTPVIGSYTNTAPTNPYKGQVWLYTANNQTDIRVFDVVSDTSIAPDASTLEVGDFWYNRNSNILSVWNGLLWIPEPNALAPWITIDLADLLNDILDAVEARLYEGISKEQRTYFTNAEVLSSFDSQYSAELKRELATWAVTNGYDPTAPNYVSTDAFTWNYSASTVFAPVNTPAVPARWFDALTAHQATVAGVIPTARPNLEPWKLMGFAAKPGTWDATYKAAVTPDDIDGSYINGGVVYAVAFSAVPTSTALAGLPIIDGLTVPSGQTVLLTSEASPSNNGLWIVSSGGWLRSSTPLADKTVVSVVNGVSYSKTQWVLQGNVLVVGVDPVTFSQIRMWKQSMWTDIQLAKPTLKLSVNPNSDALLPPYVSSANAWAVNALTTVIPQSVAAPYSFGQSSPVETVWRKSIDFRYSLAKAVFRKDPLSFLGNCWGFAWVEIDNILYDGFDMSVPGHKRFRLHGEAQAPISRTAPLSVTLVTGPVDYVLTLTYEAYTATRVQSFTLRDKNGMFLGYVNEGITGTLSSNGYVLANLRIEDQGRPFRTGDKFTITGNANGSGMTVIFDQAPYHKILGFGQTFAHAMRAASIDSNRGYAVDAYRNWDVNLGYRTGGLVSTDDLHVYTDQEALPKSSYELRFKRSPYARDMWAHALRITAVQIGSSTNNGTSSHVPANDGSDWVFRVEGYNAKYLNISYYTYDLNDTYVTFNALSKLHTPREFWHFTHKTGVVNSQLPLTITGLQNVINFLFGYSEKLEADGWAFDDESTNIDQETGRTRNWQLEIEKFIDGVYAGVALGQGHILNPFIDSIWVNQETGLLAEYFDTSLFDVTAHAAVFDTLGVKFATKDLTVLRQRGKSKITATAPMFTVHAQVDEYEHIFVFNNLSSPSTNEGLIYDPFSGARISTIKLNGRRQGAKTLRPEFGGHYLVGNDVKRNMQSSVDAVAHYYDADRAFEDNTSTNHALALLGFSTKQYMADLDLSDRTQFNFWRGLIQMKGTNASISAFLNNDRFEDAKLDEYWAYKVAEYGDSRSKIFPELKLTVDDTLQQFTKLIFDPQNTDGFEAFSVITAGEEARWFSLEDLDGETSFEAQLIGIFEKEFDASETYPLVAKLPFTADLLAGLTGHAVQLNNSALKITAPGVVRVLGYGPSTPKFNPVKLFNYVEAELVEEIAQWHPAIGQHSPVAMESINIISTQDPARYNVSTLVLGNSNYDPLRMWGANEVGRVWWDTTNLSYLPYSDTKIFTTVDERLSRWGTLADYSTIDVVEWVESSVPPSEYDAQAAIDAGNADLDSRTRAEGTVYGAKTYARDRVWAGRPIAWSNAAVADANAHPSFHSSAGAADVTLTIGDVAGQTAAYLDSKTFASLGISVGERLGAYQNDVYATKPLSEYAIIGMTKKILGTNAAGTINSVGPIGGTLALTMSTYTSAIGQMNFVALPPVSEPVIDNDGLPTGQTDWRTYLQVDIDSGESDTILVRMDRSNTTNISGATFTVTANQKFTFELKTIGLSFTFTVNAGTFNTAAMLTSIKNTLAANISFLDAALLTPIVVGTGAPVVLSNDTANNLPMWQSWSVPTQAQLTADAKYPNSQWKPYIGDFTPYGAASIAVIQDAVQNAPLVLNNGEEIGRYQTTWGSWFEVSSSIKSTVQMTNSANGAPLTIGVGTLVPVDRVSVYVNGVAQLTGTYELVGTALTLFSVVYGHEVTVIIRAYSPTAAEQAFNPDVEDDLLVQRQYKTDYQYVEVPVRDSEGAISSKKYYFWVKNRTTPALKNNLSVKGATQLLTTGPSQYLTFQHIIYDGGTGPVDEGGNFLNPVHNVRYDALALAGLNYVVTKDNAFKLRFTRNFTLRDDPQQLDLKDTHAEWSLIRPGQRTKIPESLWNKLVNAAAGSDPAGNTLPAPYRSAYDTRNGTNTRFGFGPDQVLAPTDLVTSTLLFTILNTKLLDESGSTPIPDYMLFLDFGQSDNWFSTPTNARNTLTRIWNEGKVSQINELFFAVLEDVVASNYQMTDLFKTSRLSAYSIKVVRPGPTSPSYE